MTSPSSNTSTIESLDTSDEKSRQVTLYSKFEDESKGFTVDCKYSSVSELIKVIVENDKETTSIPLDVSRESLEYIVEWINYKRGVPGEKVPKPLKATLRESCVDKWDSTFIERVAKNKKLLSDMYRDSEYLQIDPLMYLIGAYIALGLKGKSQDDMKAFLKRE